MQEQNVQHLYTTFYFEGKNMSCFKRNKFMKMQKIIIMK